MIKECTTEHITEYGKIYATAFSGEPWNDHWKPEDAEIHIKEIMESKQSYGLEYLVDGKVAGFILGSSMLFHWGRMFEINDLAVHPDYQGQGIATKLLEACLEEMKKREYTDGELGEVRQIANELCKYPTRFYTCHCTGVAAYEEMKSIMGEQPQYIHSGDEIY